MKTILAAAAMLFAQPAVSQEQDITGAILKTYAAFPPDGKDALDLMAYRTFDGIKWASAYLVVARKEQGLFCPPHTFAPTGAELFSMLQREVARKPGLAKEELGLALLTTLQDDYPCPGAPPPAQ